MVIVLLSKLAHLQIFSYGYYNTKSNNNRIEIIPIPPNRGIIYDRNGVALATNNTIYQLNIIPDKIRNLNEQLEQLKSIVNLTDEDIENFQKERLNYKSHRAVPLKYNLTQEEIAHFVVNQHLYPYVNITGTQHRYYPYGSALTHVLGYVSKINGQDKIRLEEQNKITEYVGTNNIGKIGIERFYEDLLHGQPGYEEVEVNNRGRIVRLLNHHDPEAGEDVYLTIDLKLQLYIQKLLEGRRAAVVALDPNNGEVLALVSSPSYDPNLFVDGISSTKYKELLNDPKKPLFNRTMLGSYPPASTVKPFLAVSALSEGVITPKTVVYDPGYWQLPGTTKRFRDWMRWGHGKVDTTKSIEESVDTFYYQVAYDLGIDRINYWMKKFGYGERSGIDLSPNEETRAVLPNRDWKKSRYKQSWLQGDTIPVGIGQGYWTATPLQMAKALTILVNEGVVYTPHLLLKKKSDVLDTALPKQNKPLPVEDSSLVNLISKSNWQIAKQGMYRVMFGSRGTARKVYADAQYKAAGKSGTAQVYGLKNDEIYNADSIPEHLRDHALFIAYAPFDKPKIVLAIVLENGGGGSTNGGAVAKHILDYYLLGIESTNLETTDSSIRRDD
ncbi:penicillin-binding protein 2 [Frischella perrara]|jgi:penicillin-binding protein 2|uniref:Peptidoglycan D,D-transpeptidase MrdA n=2 Tax=Frischella perrara TaxID=1267021 RepID=A0A0A7S3N5_FRIPE|nr:penicillin-binding protein 2 [Frischella perrara]MCT6874985.1 penicillin-binding protein 2 [Frischella perrara]PWV61325.1 peptidoglycan glycosyltransferase /cell elongation-specific peptidoglycan D,D-transpeptidase [Frischella perrara]PXY94378.1 penicillin-binding protein 2 [Frischella perrara]